MLCDNTWWNKFVKDLPVQFFFIGQGIWCHGNSIRVGEAGQMILQKGHCFGYTLWQTLDGRQTKEGERRLKTEQLDDNNPFLNTPFCSGMLYIWSWDNRPEQIFSSLTLFCVLWAILSCPHLRTDKHLSESERYLWCVNSLCPVYMSVFKSREEACRRVVRFL